MIYDYNSDSKKNKQTKATVDFTLDEHQTQKKGSIDNTVSINIYIE